MEKYSRPYAWFYDIDKEEEWIKEMSEYGQHLISVGRWRHGFEKGAPDEYSYRVELLKHKPHTDESRKYIEFMEETGAEYLGSNGRYAYFRKKSDTGEFELFSDIDSRIEHLSRVLKRSRPLIVLLSIIILVYFFAVVYVAAVNSLAIISFIGTFVFPLGVILLILYRYIVHSSKKRKLEAEKTLRE